MIKGNWYVDDYLPNTQTHHRVRKKVIRKKTKFQLIEILDLYDFGRSLFINGNPQSCEESEWIYHESLVHPALLLRSVKKKKRVLVLGAGEGATARELLKYKNISSITLVDIDNEALKIFEKYLPSMHQGSFINPRVKLIFDNAGDFLEKSQGGYDVIISDMTDLGFFDLGAKSIKEEKDFYNLISRKLAKNGVLTMHAGDLNEDEYKTHIKLRNFLKKIFPSVFSYRAYIPFLENEWGFVIASKNKKFNPGIQDEKIIRKRISKYGVKNKLDYFSPETLKASFIFSPRLEKIFKKH